MSLPLPFFKTKFEDKHIVDQKFYMAKHNEENRDIMLFANEVHEKPNNSGPGKTAAMAMPSLVSAPPPRESTVAYVENGGQNKKGNKGKVLSKEEEQVRSPLHSIH